MIYIQFIALSLIVVYCATKLSKKAEIIEENSNLNAIIVGAILAIATSLPEFATGITSSLIGQSAMSISNVLGSNVFNLLILALMNFLFIKDVVNNRISKEANKFNLVVIAMYIVFIISMFSASSGILQVGRIDLTAVFLVVIYAIGIKLTKEEPSEESTAKKDTKLLKKAVLEFVFFALIVLTASTFLSIVADKIVQASGMSASFVGAIFIGISTSLPELITTLALCKHKQFTMAASGILGSNMFNFLILSTVDFIDKEPLFVPASGLMVLAYMGIIFSILSYISIKLDIKNKYINLIIPMILIISYVIFLLTGM